MIESHPDKLLIDAFVGSVIAALLLSLSLMGYLATNGADRTLIWVAFVVASAGAIATGVGIYVTRRQGGKTLLDG